MPAGEGIVYSMAALDGKTVAAVGPQPDDERKMGIPPHWNSYVTVDDVDALAARVGELGGQLLAPPFDVLDVGRMAVLADPTGAVLCIWQAKTSIGASLVNTPGALCWNELATRDPQAAQEFYSALFGWELEPSEGAVGSAYWMIKNGGRWNGGMRQIGDELPPEVPAHWGVYFAVEDAADTADRAAAAGGHVLMPRTEIPGRGAFAAIADPQGAPFGVYEGQLDD
jgi:predicted enzyme related to lactoylglutathione lyase